MFTIKQQKKKKTTGQLAFLPAAEEL